jgi:hypothetical protein
MYADALYTQAKGPGATAAVLRELMKRQECAQRRYLDAIKKLALVPFAATATDGVKARWSPAGMFVGVSLTLIGVVQLRPPSVDMAKAMSS